MGAGKRFSARVAANGDQGAAVLGALAAAQEFAIEAALSPRLATQLAVMVEELISNAIRHGTDTGAMTVGLGLSHAEGHVAVTVEDDGFPFDPTADRAFNGPDPETGGGVGLALVRAWASALDYRREDGRNVLRVAVGDEDES